MKSKKAQEAIERYRQAFTDGFVTQNEIERVKEYCCLFTKVVEIAESERDAKAVEAHRRCCSVRDHNENYCLLYVAPCSDGCDRMKKFIEKLNEE